MKYLSLAAVCLSWFAPLGPTAQATATEPGHVPVAPGATRIEAGSASAHFEASRYGYTLTRLKKK